MDSPDISYLDGSHKNASFDIQPDEWNKTLGVISGAPELTLEASETQSGAKLTIELDSENQVTSLGLDQKRQKGMLIENIDMGFQTSNPMTVNLFPFRYYVDKTQQGADHPTAEFTKADLIAAAGQLGPLGPQWKKLFPVPKITVTVLDSMVEFDLAEQKRNPSSPDIRQMIQGDNVFGALMYMAAFMMQGAIPENGGLQLPNLKPANTYYLCLVPTGAALVNNVGRVLTDADFGQNGNFHAGATHPTGHVAALLQNRDGSEYQYGVANGGRVNSAHEMGHMHGSGHTTNDDGTHDVFWDPNWPGGPYAKSGVGVRGWDVVYRTMEADAVREIITSVRLDVKQWQWFREWVCRDRAFFLRKGAPQLDFLENGH